jgi:hypothetical protein
MKRLEEIFCAHLREHQGARNGNAPHIGGPFAPEKFLVHRRHDGYAADASVDPRWNKVVENAKVTLNLND